MQSSHEGESGDRRKRIAEAAYFRAERRGFDGGDPVADWIAAEREVDRRQWLDDLEARLATTGTKLKTFKKRLSGKTAEARRELEQEIQKLTGMRDSLAARVEEVRAQGIETGQKARVHAEKLWADIAASVERLSTRKRKRS